MRHLFLVLLSFAVLLPASLFSQEERLAEQYYAQGEYEKALDIFERLYDKTPHQFFYSNIVKCYDALGEYKKGISFIEKDIKKSRSNNADKYIDLGYFYQQAGDEKKAVKALEKSLDEVRGRPSIIFNISKVYSEKGLFEWALKAYEVAEKENPKLALTYQKAQVYAELGKIEEMYTAYIQMVEENPGYLGTVKTLLSRSLDTEPESSENEFIKAGILDRLQKTQNEYLADLLIHILMHEKNYRAAFVQTRAKDKRQNGNQSAVFNLGRTARSEKAYDVAMDCWNYILGVGENSRFYESALIEQYITRKAILDDDPGTSISAYEKLHADIKKVVEEADWQMPVIQLVIPLAEIQAYRLNDFSKASSLLRKMETNTRLPADFRVDGLLLQGDIQLFNAKYADAMLAYARAEKLAGDNPKGDEAKLRSAKVSYFQNDFDYALSVLDVLKASTSKLIANDAMKLALLIRENTMLDTSYEAMNRFAQADLKAFQKLSKEALRELELLSKDFPAHSLIDDILSLKGSIFQEIGQTEDAARVWEELRTKHKNSILMDEVLLKLGKLYELERKELDKAKACYEAILVDHPNSFFVNEARQRFRRLRGDTVF